MPGYRGAAEPERRQRTHRYRRGHTTPTSRRDDSAPGGGGGADSARQHPGQVCHRPSRLSTRFTTGSYRYFSQGERSCRPREKVEAAAADTRRLAMTGSHLGDRTRHRYTTTTSTAWTAPRVVQLRRLGEIYPLMESVRASVGRGKGSI